MHRGQWRHCGRSHAEHSIPVATSDFRNDKRNLVPPRQSRGLRQAATVAPPTTRGRDLHARSRCSTTVSRMDLSAYRGYFLDSVVVQADSAASTARISLTSGADDTAVIELFGVVHVKMDSPDGDFIDEAVVGDLPRTGAWPADAHHLLHLSPSSPSQQRQRAGLAQADRSPGDRDGGKKAHHRTSTWGQISDEHESTSQRCSQRSHVDGARTRFPNHHPRACTGNHLRTALLEHTLWNDFRKSYGPTSRSASGRWRVVPLPRKWNTLQYVSAPLPLAPESDALAVSALAEDRAGERRPAIRSISVGRWEVAVKCRFEGSDLEGVRKRSNLITDIDRQDHLKAVKNPPVTIKIDLGVTGCRCYSTLVLHRVSSLRVG